MRIIWNKLGFPFRRNFNKSSDSIPFKIYILSEDLNIFQDSKTAEFWGILGGKQNKTISVGSVP